MTQPFTMPDFYMPYPARRNPNLAEARQHGLAWALHTGVVADGAGRAGGPPGAAWTPQEYEHNDFALFAAYNFPEAPGVELNLMTDWFAWMWALDDLLESVDQSAENGRASLDRLLLFMPLSAGELPPEPESSVELALVDLWYRTMPGPSTQWRARYHAIVARVLTQFLVEQEQLDENLLRDPLDYLDLRRTTGGLLWTATLIEHAQSCVIPDEIHASRPVRVMTEAFADWGHLNNDILSYQKDLTNDGLLGNGVHVVREFLGADLQRAVDVVDDLSTGRIYEFEHAVHTELPALLTERGADPTTRASLARYVQGVRDSMAGHLRWSQESGRYGYRAQEVAAGGAARRIEVAARRAALPGLPGTALVAAVGADAPYRVPRIHLPHPAPPVPNLTEARQKSRAWAHAMGMIDIPGDPANAHLWDEAAFDRNDVVLCAALMHPGLSPADFELYVDMYLWSFLLDDASEYYKARRDLLGARMFYSRLPLFTPVDPAAMPVPVNCVERGLADLWRRLQVPQFAPFRAWFVEGVWVYSEILMREPCNLAEDRLPETIDGAMARRYTIGPMCQNLTTGWDDLPPEVLRSRPMRQILECHGDWLGMINDLVSYPKELATEDVVHSTVTVYRRLLGIGLQEAADVVNDLCTARLANLERLATTEIPAVLDELNLPSGDRAVVSDYLAALRTQMAGFLAYHLAAGRFDLGRAALSGPTGLGTSAARLFDHPRGAGRVTVGHPARPLPSGPTGLGTSAARLFT